VGEGPFESRTAILDLSTPSSPLFGIHTTRCCLQQGQARRWPCEVSSRPDLPFPGAAPSRPTYLPTCFHSIARTVLEADSPVNCTARPTTSLAPFRAAAALSSSARNDAASAVQPHAGYGLAKPRKEVPLPSQEPTKGLVQYALYVLPRSFPRPAKDDDICCRGYGPTTQQQQQQQELTSPFPPPAAQPSTS
jgi:hypothetical protein